MFCANCGGRISQGGKFCASCGKPVVLPEESAVLAAAAAPPPPRAQAAGLSSYPPPPPPASLGPPPPPGKRPGRHPALIPGIVTAVIIILAGVGVGTFFALGAGSGTDAASTTVATAVAASSTTALPTTTTTASTTTTTMPTTSTTEAATTTTESTTTTLDPAVVLKARVSDWMALVQSIPTTQEDLTPKLVAFLTPKDEAEQRAGEIIDWWTAPPDTSAIIKNDPFDQVLGASFSSDNSSANVLCSFNLECRDGLTTRGLEALSWKLDGGQWMRSTSYQPPSPVEGSVTPLGGSVQAGTLLWSPELLHELKHLAAKGGPTAPGMFMTVEFYVANTGEAPLAPASWQVFAVDQAGKHYGPSKAADKWWTEDVQERKTKIAPGDYTYLWYTFEVPEGADLQSFQYQVLLPGI